MSRGRYLAAVATGLAGIAIAALVIRHTELVTGRYLSAGVPPTLAFAWLMVPAGLRPAMNGVRPGLALDRQQALLVYAMMTVGVVLLGQYVVRAFLPHLVSLQYWSARYSALGKFRAYLPPGYAPDDPLAIRQYFEGSRGAGVPWRLWAAPLLG